MKLFVITLRPPRHQELRFVNSFRWLFACKSWSDFWDSEGYQCLWESLSVDFILKIGNFEGLLKKHPRTNQDKIKKKVWARAEKYFKQMLKSESGSQVESGRDGDTFEVRIIVHQVPVTVVEKLDRMGLLGFTPRYTHYEDEPVPCVLP